MAFILKKGVWRPSQAPNFLVDVDFSHPLASGLQSLFLPGTIHGFRDLTRRNTVTLSGGMPVAGSLVGPVYDTSGGAFAYATLPLLTEFTFSANLFQLAGGTRVATSLYGGSGTHLWLGQNSGWIIAAGTNMYSPTQTGWTRLTAICSGASATGYFTDASRTDVLTDTYTAAAGPLTLTFGSLDTGGSFAWGGYIGDVRVYSRAFQNTEARWLAAEPFAMLKPKISRQFYFLPSVSGGGGNIYNVGLTEAMSAADTVSDTAILPAAIADPLTAADTVSNTATLPSAVNDNLTPSDTFSNGSIFSGAIAEAVTPAETITNNATLPAALADTITPTDAPSSTAQLPAAIAEAANATNSQATTATLPSSVADTLTPADAPSSTAILAAGIVETSPITDNPSSNTPGIDSILEAMTATDVYSATIRTNGAIADTVSPLDALAALTQVPAGIVEAAATSDALATSGAFGAVVAESAPMVDAALANLIAQIAILEAAHAVDLVDVSRPARTPSKCDSLKMPFAVRSLSVGCDCA